jgi:hypothetical protein
MRSRGASAAAAATTSRPATATINASIGSPLVRWGQIYRRREDCRREDLG